MSAPIKDSAQDEDLFAPALAPRIVRGVLAVLLVVGTIGWFAGWLDPVKNYIAPVKVEVTGKVTFNGEPLTRGLVETKPVISGHRSADGDIQPDGTFRLKTINQPGAFAGTHYITVRYDALGGGMMPPSLLPSEYTNSKTTPFHFTFQRNRANTIELRLKGVLKEGPKPRGGSAGRAEATETPDSAKSPDVKNNDDAIK